MNILHSKDVPMDVPIPKIAQLLQTLSEGQLRAWVNQIAVPRHFIAEPDQNRAVADWLSDILHSFGFEVMRQGEYSNVVAFSGHFSNGILVGAHYDSVAMCPGADDNASALAALLGCAFVCANWKPALPVVFVAFNREECGLMGSRDF